jgi:hypothetical protein
MALSIELLKAMDGQHAVNALRADFDPIINTPLEAFLIDWIETLVDEAADSEPVAEVMADHGLETADIEALAEALIEDTDKTVALLKALGEANLTSLDELNNTLALDKVLEEAGIDTAEELTRQLELAEQFRSIAADAGDVFSRLTQLTTTVQE